MPQVVLSHEQIKAMIRRDVEAAKAKRFYQRCDIMAHKAVIHRRIKKGIGIKKRPDKLLAAKL
jgi:hypothetical protein